MLAGVCAGLARRWRVDPNLIRIALVVLAFFGGLGLAIYAAGLALMPKDGTSGFPIRRWLPFTRTWPDLLVVAVTLAALVLLAGLPSHGFGLGPLLVVFGFWHFGSRSGKRPLPPTEPTPFERQAEAWRDRLAEQQVPGYANPATAATWQQPYTDPSDRRVSDGPVVPAQQSRRLRPATAFALAAGGLFVAGLGVWILVGGFDQRLLGILVPVVLVVVGAGMLLLSRKPH